MFPNCLTWLHISIRLQIKCREPTPKNEDVGTIATLDTLADHFKFHGAQKTAGKDPAASGGSLKIGVKDTLTFFRESTYLFQCYRPFCSGVGVKVGPISLLYFDVPEAYGQRLPCRLS